MRSPTDAPRRHERWTVRVVDLFVGLAALAGLGVVVWTVAAGVLGLQLVTFATGSMSPAFPAGSVAVARRVPLAQVAQGDVVTVDRGAGRLPITHRVLSIERHGAVADLVLKGDANRYEDPSPYRVTSVRQVVLPLAVLSGPIRFATAPAGVGAGAAAATAAALWATWPTRRRRPAAPVAP